MEQRMIISNDNLKQGSSEWLKFRAGRIGASSAPVIMKQQLQWGTPYSLWKDILTAQDSDPNTPLPKKESNWAIERGHRFEPIARARYELHHSHDCPEVTITHPEHEWLMASLDGWNIEKKIVLEIKIPGKEVIDLAKDGVVSPKYVYQLEQQLFIANALHPGDWVAHFFVGVVGKNPQSGREEWQGDYLVEYRSNPEAREKWLKEVFTFWNENVVKRIPPELLPQDCQVVSNPKARAIFDDLHDELVKMKTLEAQIKVIKKRVDELKDQASELITHAKEKWNNVEITKRSRIGSVDYARLHKETGVNVDEYRGKTSEYYEVKLVK